jgi:uncharacterized membrane protein
MFGLTGLGTFHTAISVVALIAGALCLLRDRAISLRTAAGKVYVLGTAIVCATGFGIFQHGGFGKPHALGIVTLVALAAAVMADAFGLFGRAGRYVAAIGYLATFFFHLIPAVAETTTRLPLGAPLLPNAEAPVLQAATGCIMLAFLLCAGFKVRQMWRAPPS